MHEGHEGTKGTKKKGRLIMLRVGSTMPQAVEDVAQSCVDCGFTVHQKLGPGFKEIIYERAFCLELDSRGIKYESEKPILVQYKEWQIPGQKVDLVVEGVVIVEIKAVPRFREIHRDQLLSYLKTMNLRLGLLMNFHGATFRGNCKRVAN
jgi:GxxExxY protein